MWGVLTPSQALSQIKFGAGGEGDDRGWDGWMASLTRWTWVSVNSGSWWWTGRLGVLRFMGSQRVGHDWATELKWTCISEKKQEEGLILVAQQQAQPMENTAAQPMRRHYQPEGLLSSSENSLRTAAAATKSLQSCLTLCDPIDGSPPGFSVPGILQARTLEWVAISFINAWKWKLKVKSLSHVRLFVTPWTAAYQAPPSMGFSRQEYWSGVPLPSPSLRTVPPKAPFSL